MLWLKLLNARIIIWCIIAIAGTAGAFWLRIVAITDSVQHTAVQQSQKNRQGLDHYQRWRLK